MTQFAHRLNGASELAPLSADTPAQALGTLAAARLMAGTPAIAATGVVTSAVVAFAIEQTADD